MFDALSGFRDAMRATGLEPPAAIERGRIHRFAGIGKRPSNRAGWCVLFDDGLGGSFGDWSSGLSETWQADWQRPFSPEERIAFMKSVKEARALAEADRLARQAEAATRASAIWKTAPPAPDDHPYLARKGIKANGARLHKDTLVLPVKDFASKLTSLQFVGGSGRKLLLSGGRKRGCFIPVAGDLANARRVIICEGWATGCTLSQHEPASTVLAAIDAGNLEPVAVAARRHWPSAELVVASDDDRLTASNPGKTKARAAAIAAGALIALPQWPDDAPVTLTDFNDLARWLDRRTA